MFPVMLQLTGRRCLVVGGGPVAFRKIQNLVSENARVTVVAPSVVRGIEVLEDAGRITLERREFEAGEVDGYALVFAATDARDVNRRVYEEAVDGGIWVNVADDPEFCTFHLPSVLRRGPLHVAVASEGRAPFAVRRFRRLLERWIGPQWGEWMEGASRFRERIRALGIGVADREALFDAYFEATVDPETFDARVATAAEEQALLDGVGSSSDDRIEVMDTVAPARSVEPKAGGLVSLVGAGPGNPGLLTLRGHRRLMEADAVVYDRLAVTALPCDLPPNVELHSVGKTAGKHPVPQEEINAMLIRLSRQGKRVVRLKGGDPYVFGRGGEEAEELARAGLPFEVIPGVTSGIAGPGWAGIPVTHRGEAVRVNLLTAHESAKDASQVRWDLLAQDSGSTLVAYMGMGVLPVVVEKLVESGMDPQTPAAVVQQGTLAAQRCVVSPLVDLPDSVRREGLEPPALIVVGPTVRHAPVLNWIERLPLAGRRVLVVRGSGLEDALETAGADIVGLSFPVTPAARVVLEAAPVTDVVVTTEEEVEALDLLRGGVGWGPSARLWCLGTKSQKRARAIGWNLVHPVHDEVDLETLVDTMAHGDVGSQ